MVVIYEFAKVLPVRRRLYGAGLKEDIVALSSLDDLLEGRRSDAFCSLGSEYTASEVVFPL